MWKFLFAFFLLYFSTSGHAQDVLNTLGKYSYQVQLTKQAVRPMATGFFVRYEQRLFFITTAHCLTGSGVVNANLVDNSSDTLFINISSDTSSFAYLALPVSEINRTTKHFTQPALSDVYVFEIKNAKKYPVFSIEDFFEEEVPCELAKQVVVAGRSEDSKVIEGEPAKAFQLNSSLSSAYCNYPYLPGAKVYDELHYTASFKEDMMDRFLTGSPAYLVTHDDNVVFGGIYIGSPQGVTSTASIVRPEYVMNAIMRRILDK